MRTAVLAGLVTLALAGSKAAAQDVTYDYDKTADFGRVKTYAWTRSTGLNDELNHRRIVAAVDAQLTSKGLIQVAPGATPDVLVSYHAHFDTSLEVIGNSSGTGRFGLGGFRSGTARVDEVLNGSLGLDIIDARSGSIIWRSVASKAVDVHADPEKRDKNIAKVAEKLLKNYPPRA